MLSNSCLVLPAVVKQQQEEISRNHVPSLFAVSVQANERPSPGGSQCSSELCFMVAAFAWREEKLLEIAVELRALDRLHRKESNLFSGMEWSQETRDS